MSSLMCSIAEEKKLPMIEDRALKRLGQAAMKDNLIDLIPQETSSTPSDDEDVKVGARLLDYVQRMHESVDEQKRAHQLLNFIHRVSLDVL